MASPSLRQQILRVLVLPLEPRKQYRTRTIAGREFRAHRLIATCLLGRPLLRTEDVHHRNGKIWDNRPHNLQVMSHAAHISETKAKLPLLAECANPQCGRLFVRRDATRRFCSRRCANRRGCDSPLRAERRAPRVLARAGHAALTGTRPVPVPSR